MQPFRRKLALVDQDTDAILRELICQHLGLLPEALSSDGSAIDAVTLDEPDAHAMAEIDRDRQAPDRQAVPFVRCRLVPAKRTRGQLLRAVALSPYETQLIVEDALRAGTGARLTLELADVPDASVCDAVREQLSPLTRRGIQVRVRCDRGECRHGTPGAAA